MKQKGNIIYDEKDWYIANRSFDYGQVLQGVLDRIEDFNNEDALYQAIDDELIYYYQEWIIAKEFYSSPKDLDFEQAFSWFLDDLYNAIEQIKDNSVKE